MTRCNWAVKSRLWRRAEIVLCAVQPPGWCVEYGSAAVRSALWIPAVWRRELRGPLQEDYRKNFLHLDKCIYINIKMYSMHIQSHSHFIFVDKQFHSFFSFFFLCLCLFQRGHYDNPRWLSPGSVLLLNQMMQVSHWQHCSWFTYSNESPFLSSHQFLNFTGIITC